MTNLYVVMLHVSLSLSNSNAVGACYICSIRASYMCELEVLVDRILCTSETVCQQEGSLLMLCLRSHAL